ncbi:MAG: TlyA family RNA methyltransferase [Cyanobacteria bacterium SBLK]|nr:TlyA family RNA methyltransferase [Cyanobacteria bacterium SBLK]
MVKQRLDMLLVDRNLAESRQQAQRLIRAGEVKVSDRLIDKPGTEVDAEAKIAIKAKPRYVSRGGEKLEKALNTFKIPVESRICLDGGISTGGFTDCLLQAGAKLVYGVDVGYGQVAWKLRQCDRVILKERTNLRYLKPEELYNNHPCPNLGVVDVSFISLNKILEPFWNLLNFPKEAILLVKPQFEVGKDRVGKKGVVRNPKDRAEAIFRVLETARKLGWRDRGLTPSPITGPAGNIEYLLWLSTEGKGIDLDREQIQQETEIAIDQF